VASEIKTILWHYESHKLKNSETDKTSLCERNLFVFFFFLNDRFGTVAKTALQVARLTRVYCRVAVSLCRSNYYHLPKAQTSLRAKKQRTGEKAGWEADPLSQA